MKKIKKNVRLESLKIQNQPKVRADLIDYDKEFLDDLKKNHPDEYKWLAQFTDEYVGAAIQLKKDGTPKSGFVHETAEQAKSCFDANNHRNNDVLGVNKANRLTNSLETELEINDGWYINNPEYNELNIVNTLSAIPEDDDELTYYEYLDCRNQMNAELQQEHDKRFIEEMLLSQDDFYILLIIWESKEITTRKFDSLVKNNQKLQEFIQESTLFKPNKNRRAASKNKKD